ncbi:putative RNA-directed DNA polymerase [Helianthus annuus]|nr:putative RNA-directed DNA polymerase [Helianthus annuus]
MDGPLVLNEILGWLKKYRRCGMFFKVDIRKAYDSVNWAFLDSIMIQMNFPSRWRAWVMATLRSAKASVLVNGSPTREIEYTRGLRQGDPLSPFLFVMAMEALSGIMKAAESTGLFKGIKVTNDGPYLSHLIYADDVMFVGECIFGIGVSEQVVQEMANRLRCKQGTFPFKHLGILVGANMNLVRNWKSVIEIFRNRLSIWKAKTLSYGGRITLIKSVLNSLPTYYFSLFKAPIRVLETLDRIRRVFFLGWLGGKGSDELGCMG